MTSREEDELEVLLIEDLLCKKNVDRVADTAACGSHHRDDGVLLDIEGTGVQLDRVAEEPERGFGHVLGPSETQS